MIRKPIRDELLEQFDRLTPELQRRVVDFARQSASHALCGVKGIELLSFAHAMEESDIQQMRDAIDEGCGQVDPHEW